MVLSCFGKPSCWATGLFRAFLRFFCAWSGILERQRSAIRSDLPEGYRTYSVPQPELAQQKKEERRDFDLPNGRGWRATPGYLDIDTGVSPKECLSIPRKSGSPASHPFLGDWGRPTKH